MDILVAIIVALVGLVACFSGIRLFFAILPVMGFMVGFFAGAAMMATLFDDHPFLGTTTGIVIGLIIGVVFAALSYLFWYVGAIMTAGAAGAILGLGFMGLFGADGFLAFIVSMIVAVVFMIGALALALPVYIVVFNTAMAGAAGLVGSLMLLFNQIDSEDIGTGAIWNNIGDHFLVWILWIVLAAVGIGAQLQMMASVTLPEDKWSKSQAGSAAA